MNIAPCPTCKFEMEPAEPSLVEVFKCHVCESKFVKMKAGMLKVVGTCFPCGGPKVSQGEEDPPICAVCG